MSEKQPQGATAAPSLTLAAWVQTWLPVLTLLGGALWGLYTYVDHAQQAAALRVVQEEKEARLRAFEASKPFFDKMFAGYIAAAQLVGILSTVKPDQSDWNDAAHRFLLLARGELQVVNVTEVKSRVESAERALLAYSSSKKDEDRLLFDQSARKMLNEMGGILLSIYEAHGFGPNR